MEGNISILPTILIFNIWIFGDLKIYHKLCTLVTWTFFLVFATQNNNQCILLRFVSFIHLEVLSYYSGWRLSSHLGLNSKSFAGILGILNMCVFLVWILSFLLPVESSLSSSHWCKQCFGNQVSFPHVTRIRACKPAPMPCGCIYFCRFLTLSQAIFNFQLFYYKN